MNKGSKDGGRINWIDGGKFLAILAVLIDHTKGVLYSNAKVAMGARYSVILFILLSGITVFQSDIRYETEKYGESIIRGTKRIVIEYLVATFIYQICITRFFDFFSYWNFVTRFNISQPLYFVLLYIQLMLVNKLLYNALTKLPGGVYKDILLLCIIVFISYLTTNYTNVLDVYGGGGKLFGGTYLIVFFLGMLIEKYGLLHYSKRKNSLCICLVAGISAIAWWAFACNNWYALDAKLPFGEGINPPSITEGVYGIIMLVFSFGLFSFLDECNKYVKLFTKIPYYIGRSTMYVFLYHRLFLDVFLEPHVTCTNIWIKRLLYLSIMIGGPILIMLCIRCIKRITKS